MAEPGSVWHRLRQYLVAGCLLAVSALVPSGGDAQSLPTTAHDSKLPIEITADSLEVKQNEQLAIFRGNVDALQGKMQLTANEVRVHYRPDSAKDAEGTISRINAHGGVRFSTPSETARGDSGVYDVDAQIITLTGSVVLTRGGDVIRGEKLVLNLATGESKIESKQRVRGLFRPKNDGSGS
ncbi:MAG: lipopolysaccharide transport periplasmic protein LptA [Proteobacteria bacterium]|nr:lipopolysaccharide transport periplasmic protein LptA [Pseudomonadota bacterium]